MANADDIRGLTQDVANAYEDRVKLMADLANAGRKRTRETSNMLDSFSKERQAMGAQLKADLANAETERTRETSNMLDNFSEERQRLGTQLKADLANAETERKRQTHNMMNNIKKENRERTRETSNMLDNFSKERQRLGTQLKADLAKTETGRRRQAQVEIKQRQDEEKQRQDEEKQRTREVSAMLESFRKDQAETAEAWQVLVATMQAKRAVRPPVEKVPAVEEVAAPPIGKVLLVEKVAPLPAEEVPEKVEEVAKEELSLEGQVLKVISEHQEGIKLFDIGDTLDKDWRVFIPVTKALLEEGKIRKEDVLYYPVSSSS